VSTTSDETGLPPQQAKKQRLVRAPVRFKEDDRQALHAAQWLLPQGHLSREVERLLARVDTSEVEAQSSPLGQHAFHPRRLLALWVYASLTGVHHASKLHERMKTDAALRFLSGGHVVSARILSGFRAQHLPLLQSALEATVAWAREEGHVDVQALAVDSLRLRAHASRDAVRVGARSKERLH
jgi:transposase